VPSRAPLLSLARARARACAGCRFPRREDAHAEGGMTVFLPSPTRNSS
jgi:hypothetical protein